jgi:hypothetical protein
MIVRGASDTAAPADRMRDIDVFDGTSGEVAGILDAPATFTGGRMLRRVPAWTSTHVSNRGSVDV